MSSPPTIPSEADASLAGAELTTQDAADVLNISQRRSDADRRAALAELAAYDQEIGL